MYWYNTRHQPTIFFQKNKLDLNPENIEVIADVSGVTMKVREPIPYSEYRLSQATNMGFLFTARAKGTAFFKNPDYFITYV